jgi:hypothetical protein
MDRIVSSTPLDPLAVIEAWNLPYALGRAVELLLPAEA